MAAQLPAERAAQHFHFALMFRGCLRSSLSFSVIFLSRFSSPLMCALFAAYTYFHYASARSRLFSTARAAFDY